MIPQCRKTTWETYRRLESKRIPRRRILQVVLHAVVARMQEEMFRACHSHRRFRRNELRGLERSAYDLLLASRHDPAHEPEFARFGGSKIARGERELADEALVSRDFRKARERSDVSC